VYSLASTNPTQPEAHYSDVLITPSPKNDGTKRLEYVVAVLGDAHQDAINDGVYYTLLDVERDAFKRRVCPERIKPHFDKLRRGEPAQFNLGDVLELPDKPCVAATKLDKSKR
jgi:hypothetical protein